MVMGRQTVQIQIVRLRLLVQDEVIIADVSAERQMEVVNQRSEKQQQTVSMIVVIIADVMDELLMVYVFQREAKLQQTV